MRFDIFSITTNQVIVAYLLRGFKIMYAISFAFFYLILSTFTRLFPSKGTNKEGCPPSMCLFS